jgi:hypothetical protein
VQRQTRAAPSSGVPFRRSAAALAISAAAAFTAGTAPARADGAACPAVASAFDANGARFADLDSKGNRKLEILAIGSSSTEGIGASAPAYAYPARLEAELSKGVGLAAEVRNAGVGGELAARTLQRLQTALKTGWAELVIWQVGTNDALVGVDERLFRATVESGVAARPRRGRAPALDGSAVHAEESRRGPLRTVRRDRRPDRGP